MQSRSRILPFKQSLAGASPATDAIPIFDFGFAICDCADFSRSTSKTKILLALKGVSSFAHRFAKAEVRGANPPESTNSFGE
jgi:hypothetical protein